MTMIIVIQQFAALFLFEFVFQINLYAKLGEYKNAMRLWITIHAKYNINAHNQMLILQNH